MSNVIKVSKGILSSIKTIWDGINQANEGDIIEIAAEVYKEDLLINKNISIRSASGKADVYIDGRVVVYFEHENLAKLSQLSFQNEGRVYIEKGSLHILDCAFIDGKQEAIHMDKGTNVIVENTVFKENDKPLYLQGNAQFNRCEWKDNHGETQVVIMEGSKVYFTNCHLSKGKNAMTVEQNCHLTINASSISHFSENGLYIQANSKCDINNTNISHIKGKPIQVVKATLHMQGCLLENNDDMQIFLKEKSSATLKEMTIRHGKGNGVMVDDSTVSMKNSKLTKHDKPQLFIRNGGKLNIDDCQLNDVAGNHLRAIGQSSVEISRSNIFDSGFPCLAIENSKAKLVACNIYHSKSDALLIKDKSNVLISRSYISRNEKSCIFIREASQVKVKESRIFDSSNGIILKASSLEIDSSSIYDHKNVQLFIEENAKAKVNDSNFYRGKSNAIYAKDAELLVTKSSVEESELPQVYICGQSEARIEDTRIHNGESNGVSIHDQSSVKMVQSVISNHTSQKSPAVFVKGGTSLEMTATTIRNNASEACYILADANVLLSQCLIAGNGDLAQVYINGDGNYHITESTVVDSEVIGINIHDANPTIEYCIVNDNKEKNIAQTENSRPNIKHSITGDKVFATGDERKNNEEKMPTEQEDVSFETLMEELHAYIGLSNVKSYIQNLTNILQVSKFRQQQNMIANDVDVPHLVFTGNPGTGKTTVGRLIGKIFKSIGLLESGHLIEVSREDLVGSYIGHSEERTKEKIEEAMGGVLFIDEAYALAGADDSDRDFGKKVIDVLVPALENNRGKFVVIVAGYTNEMDVFMKSNPGLADRFTQKIEFHDYNPDELLQIFHKIMKESGYFITEAAEEELFRLITNEYRVRDETFGNARRVRKIHGDMILAHAERISKIPKNEWTDTLAATYEMVDVLKTFKKDRQADFEIPVNEVLLEEKLAELDRLIGLTELKQKIHELVELNRYYRSEGRDKSTLINHMILVGNPGTGKTEVARIIAGIYEALGLLERGQLIEVDRNGLVSRYQGGTEEQTTNQIERAMGSTLFIDEAYTLTNRGGNDPGQIAVETLLKKMSDHQGEFMVLAAGYRNEMQEFKESNPGLTRRFSATLEFPDYTPDELMDITVLHLGDYVLDNLASAQLTLHYHVLYENRDEHFGNAGLASSIARESIKKLDYRMAQLAAEEVNEENKRSITKEDLALLGK